MSIKAARIHGLEVSVCGYSELPEFAGHGVTRVVSLWDGYHLNDPQVRQFLEAVFPSAKVNFGFFNDVFTPFSGDYSPQIDAVREILEFTSQCRSGDYLLVHCAAGISRSTAVAFAALCQRAGPGFEAECCEALKRIRPAAAPNPLIVKFADGLLGRKGAMIEVARGGPSRRT